MAQIQIITDNSPMPFGKYKGVKMSEVPDEYLLWLYKKGMYDTPASLGVREYIKDNLDAIKINIARNGNSKNYMFNPCK